MFPLCFRRASLASDLDNVPIVFSSASWPTLEAKVTTVSIMLSQLSFNHPTGLASSQWFKATCTSSAVKPVFSASCGDLKFENEKNKAKCTIYLKKGKYVTYKLLMMLLQAWRTVVEKQLITRRRRTISEPLVFWKVRSSMLLCKAGSRSPGARPRYPRSTDMVKDSIGGWV